MSCKFQSKILLLLSLLFLLPILACGRGVSADEEPAPEPTTEIEEALPTGPVSGLEEAKQAMIRIEAQGTFVDPEEGLLLNVAGSGSGFIIDPSGIAVTNNHVVTGAALLRVYISGEEEPRNAKILGVSECSDLAVIEIEGDEEFAYLDWHDGPVPVGVEVRTAGFPLGESEYTITRGIVNRANRVGQTEWASIDSVIEHDATIRPGNSGGPLLDQDGRVIGVNFAGSSITEQYYAIAREEALPIIEQLRTGQDLTSIGINGVAISDEEEGLGIWVSSVKSGSPAYKTGVRPGDIIRSLEGLRLADNGTMADYCDILRTRNPDDIMSIEVLRLESRELVLLEGSINGDEKLEPVNSRAPEE